MANTLTSTQTVEQLIAHSDRVGGKGSYGTRQNWDSYKIDSRIRRLTPVECERLQGLPDGYTAFGYYAERPTRADLLAREQNPELWAYQSKRVNGEDVTIREVSDTQRYKGLGNAFTVNVIEAIVTAMLNEGCLV